MRYKMAKEKLKKGQLRVWWNPQVPGKAFRVEVDNVKEAILLIVTLGKYDAFQFENKIKPDYSNAGGLEVYDGKEWSEYYDDDGRDIDDIIEAHEEWK